MARSRRYQDPLLDYGWGQQQAYAPMPTYEYPLLDAPRRTRKADLFGLDNTDPLFPTLPTPRQHAQSTATQTLSPEAEQSLLSELGQNSLTALQYAGETIDKPGRAVRGVLSGLGMGDRAGEYGGGLLNLIPFSDAMGITDPEKSIHPSDLTGLKPESSDDWATWGGKHAANLGVGLVTDPLFWATSGLFPAASRGMNALKASGLVNKGTDLAGIMGKSGMGTRNLYQTTKFGDALTELEKALPPEHWSKGSKALGEFLAKKGSSIGELTDKPLGGLANLGILGGGRWPWATVGTGPVSQTIGKGMDKASSAIRWSPPVRYANALFNQRGTQGALSRAVQEAAPGYTAGDDAVGIAERASGNRAYNLVRDVPSDKRQYVDRLGEAKTPSAIATARAEAASNLGWTSDQIDDVVDAASKARDQSGTRPMGAAANDWNSWFTNYMSRQAQEGVFPGDVLGGTARSKSGMSASSQSDISRNLALDLPGGLTQIKSLFSSKKLAEFIAKEGPGLSEGKLAAEMRRLHDADDPILKNIPKRYLTKEGWEELGTAVDKADPSGTLHDYLADNPTELFKHAKKIGIKTKPRYMELAHILLRATPEGRAVGIFDEPFEQTIARMTRDQGMRENTGNFLVNILSKKGVIDKETGIFDTGATGAKIKPYRATSGAKPAEVGEILTNASLLHGTSKEGALQYLAKKVGVNPNDAFAMERLKLSAVSPDVVSDITKWQKRFDAPEPVTGALKILDWMTSFFKSGVTTRPNFAFRNELSGGFKTILDQQFGPRAAKVAYNSLRGAALTERDAKYMLDVPIIRESLNSARINPANATPKQVGEALSSVMYTHWGEELGKAGNLSDLGADVATRARNAVDMRPEIKPVNLKSVLNKITGKSDASWNPKKLESPTDWAPFAMGAEINRMAESHPRITAWIKNMAEGYDPAVAADMARESQFRYSPKSFTNFERKVMKRLVPFYSFAKQSAASTAKELIERPGGPLGQFIKAEGQLSDSSGDFVPDYIKQGLSIPVPAGTPLIGPEEGGDPRFLTGFGLMHETPFGYLGGGPSGMALAGLSNLNPLLKGAIETATGVSTFQRGPGGARELSEQDPLIGRLMSNVYDTATGERTKEPPRLPQLLENIVSNSPASALLSMSRTLADPRKSLTAKALNTLTGSRVTDVPERTTEGITGKLLTQMMKESGARSFENVYFSKQQKAEAQPEQLQAMLRLEAFKNMLAKRQRARAKAALATAQ